MHNPNRTNRELPKVYDWRDTNMKEQEDQAHYRAVLGQHVLISKEEFMVERWWDVEEMPRRDDPDIEEETLQPTQKDLFVS